VLSTVYLVITVRFWVAGVRMILINCEVINYEVVLSNAAIVNANATSNPDLFWALKGGGDQFGEAHYFNISSSSKVF
jgi:hypothetical protein